MARPRSHTQKIPPPRCDRKQNADSVPSVSRSRQPFKALPTLFRGVPLAGVQTRREPGFVLAIRSKHA